MSTEKTFEGLDKEVDALVDEIGKMLDGRHMIEVVPALAILLTAGVNRVMHEADGGTATKALTRRVAKAAVAELLPHTFPPELGATQFAVVAKPDEDDDGARH